MKILENVIHQRSFSKQEIQERLYQSIVLESLMPIALLDSELRFISANEAFCQMLGLPSQHQFSQFHLSVLPFFTDKTFSSLLHEVTDNKIPKFEVELAVKTLSNQLKTFKIKMSRWGNQHHFEGGILQLENITKERQKITFLETKLHVAVEKNNQLQRYIHNQLQLENFAYIASHDMKEPLRMIGNFSQLLAKRCAPYLPLEGKEYLTYIMDGVRNMNRFVDDLLRYSQLDKQEHIIQDTNFDILFFLLQKEFEDDLLALNSTLNFPTLPSSVKCSKEKIKSLFRQLFSNAIKFSKKDVPLVIDIIYRETPSYHVFEFKDNGIGMNQNFAEKVFLLFKKLHSKSQYPGTGIGLALCKKIIEQHQGEINIESKLGQGCKVVFTIKKIG